jgi:predicted transcriptional regulator
MGFKKKDIIGRYINKVACFEKPDLLLELIKKVNDSEKTFSEPFIIITKDYSKKIFNISCSLMHQKGVLSGVICIGRDITYDRESYQNLIPGHSYLITDKNESSILDLFNTIISNETSGLYFSRSPDNPFADQIYSQQIQQYLIGPKSNIKTPAVSTLGELRERIEEFVSMGSRGVILINDIHYFITKFSFIEFINTCYEIIDSISQSESILLLSLNKLIVSENQFAVLESEFEPLPGKNIDVIEMKDELFEIIQFIYEENSKNALVSFTKLMTRFNIVYFTASKRIERLFEEGLVFTKKYGKTRIIHLTEKGKSLVQKRRNT